MERHPELRELLLDRAEADQTGGAIERERAIATLRKREEHFQAVVGALQHSSSSGSQPDPLIAS